MPDEADSPPQRSFEQMKELAAVEPADITAPTYEEYLRAVRTQERLDRERFSET